jgi:hypothetical protein
MQENEVNNVDLAAAGVAPNVSQALEAHYLLLDRQLPALSALCLSLLSIGGILFLLPSAEVALTVVARFPAIWLASYTEGAAELRNQCPLRCAGGVVYSTNPRLPAGEDRS